MVTALSMLFVAGSAVAGRGVGNRGAIVADRAALRPGGGDDFDKLLPPSIRLQSAARLGDRYLVAWGSTERRANAIVPVIVAQIVVNGEAIGKPLLVATGGARPAGFLQVIVLGDRYMVLWNDHRDDAGGYGVVVDTLGVPGMERRISGRPFDSLGVVRHRVDGGWQLLWSRMPARDSIDAVMLGGNGLPLKEVAAFAPGGVGAAIYPSALPGWLIIDREGLRPLLIDPLGEHRDTAMAYDGAGGRFFLDESGEVITFGPGVVTIYGSPLAAHPERTIRYTIPSALPGSEIVTRGAGGDLQVTYLPRGVNEYGSFVKAGLMRRSLDIAGGLGEEQLVGYFAAVASATQCHYYHLGSSSAQVQRSPGNIYKTSATYAGTYEMTCALHYSDRDTSHVWVVTDASRTFYANFSGPPVVIPPLRDLDATGPVLRIIAPDSSDVELLVGSRRVRLSAPMAS